MAALLLQLFMIFLSISVGWIAVSQAGFNLLLSEWCNDVFRAAFISTLIGCIELFPLFIFCKQKEISLSISFQLIKEAINKDIKYIHIFLWHGLCGVIWLSSAIYLAPILSFGLYFLCAITGQICSSMLIDYYGLIWSKQKKLTIINLFGAILAFIGVILFQIQNINENDYDLWIILYCLLTLLIGTVLTIQAALNRKLKCIMNGTPYQVAFISFTNSLFILFIISILTFMINNDWFKVSNSQLFWYIFIGGFLGPFIVTIYVICPQYIGYSSTFIAGILGYLTSSLLYDYFGVFGVDKTDITFLKIAGVICVLVASVLVNIHRNENMGDTDLDTMRIIRMKQKQHHNKTESFSLAEMHSNPVDNDQYQTF